MKLHLLAVVATTACGASEAETPKPKVDPCGAAALKLGTAKALTIWVPPAGCTPKAVDGRTVLKTQAELDAQFECKSAKLGIDLAKHALVQVGWSMSPASVGLDAHDDGKQITLVTRFRKPCPKDPQPMPMTSNRWFLLPVGGPARTFAETNCTVETKCS